MLLPARTADTGTLDPRRLRDELAALIPEEHREFVRRILEENGIPTRPIDAPFKYTGNLIITNAGTLPMIDIILGHRLCRFFVSALGTPRPDVIRRFHDADVKVGARAGNVQHAVRHVQGGVDIVVAQGTEAAATPARFRPWSSPPTSSMRWLRRRCSRPWRHRDRPDIAACLALGAKGVWTGSIWLTVVEAATTAEERAQLIAGTASDTVRSKSMTGKPVRQLREHVDGRLVEARCSRCAGDPAPDDARRGRVADDVADRRAAAGLAKPIVGQIVGRMNAVRSVREVMDDLVAELITTITDLPEVLESDI